jgi:hypothetical protein
MILTRGGYRASRGGARAPHCRDGARRIDRCQGASLGLRLIDAIDPPVEASVTVELPKTPEDVDAMPYDDFIRLCAQLGLDTGVLPKPR